MSAAEPDPRSGVQPDGSWLPVFEGQRPPFAPGHELAVQHGAYSPRKVDPRARELVEALLAEPDTSYLAALSYRAALWDWAKAQAQAELLEEFLVSRTAEGDAVPDLADERVRSAYLLLHRARAHADRVRTRLGLDPLSRARLGRDVASAQADTARLMAELHRRDGAAAGGAGVVVDGEVES